MSKGKQKVPELQPTPPHRTFANAGSGSNGWGESRAWHAGDERLRRHGFRVEHRRKGKPAVWSRDGGTFTEAEASAVCDREEREALEAKGTR